MKKVMQVTLLGLASLIIVNAANADCGYTDKINVRGPAGTHIIGNISAYNAVSVYQTGTAAFAITDNQPNPNVCTIGTTGVVTVTVGTDDNNKCKLVIEDGPFLFAPTVENALCIGKLNYRGVSTGPLAHEFSINLN